MDRLQAKRKFQELAEGTPDFIGAGVRMRFSDPEIPLIWKLMLVESVRMYVTESIGHEKFEALDPKKAVAMCDYVMEQLEARVVRQWNETELDND